ncbi:hypothetical protein CMQ_1894 [Grosmannia clavigera kw1407]|uniref:Uncharacterized protein n=1 Tax=Grosmannia clavigera (strain kw1407 / UAMH 11150) TaxID=655863 RepID=F0XNC1_GROCL|nr:uncharacterized protein CMQ_1894 [Grosmannia clavigera kw1407]EFX00813.1 hypothetical protein CMQ_1894 [Grosmannia clavigera kw1407]
MPMPNGGRTESKATTLWAVNELAGTLPKLLQDKIRLSRYYTRTTDSITIQAQTQRSRSANAADNQKKMYEEVLKMYDEAVPGDSSPENARKYKLV